MLIINNLDKIVGAILYDDWVVTKYELVGEYQYQFEVTKIIGKIIGNNKHAFSIQLERKPIGEGRYIYEVWAWGKDGNVIRKMVYLKYFRSVKDFVSVLDTIVKDYQNS